MKLKTKFFGSSLCSLILLFGRSAHAEWQVGAGLYDITGPAAEVGMMGYGQLGQTTAGIHTRLWSRAFVIKSTQENSQVALVVADLCFISQSVKDGVVARLKAKGLGEFSDANVMIMATHTHSGPGGFSHHATYNVMTLGFMRHNYETIVSGITESILRAQRNSESAYMTWNQARVSGLAANRSLDSFRLNPEAAGLEEPTNPLMSQLFFEAKDGRPLGLLNWFSVHATALGNKNHLISSDNKGLAAIYMDREFKSSFYDPHPFVSAFANSDEGDSSPHTEGFEGIYDNSYGLKKLSENALGHFRAALNLRANGFSMNNDRVRFAHTYVRMPGLVVSPEFTGLATDTQLCGAALGVSFAAGAEDGPGGLKISEGVVVGEKFSKRMLLRFVGPLIKLFLGAKLLSDDPCQHPKPVFLDASHSTPKPWTAEVLPVQIFIIGNLAIVGAPGEMTTVAGLRLRKVVKTELQSMGVDEVVIAGLSNSYAHYVATPEEYDFQNYEGASTLYGRYTLPGLIQEYTALSRDLRSSSQSPQNNAAHTPGPQPEDLSPYLVTVLPPVLYDPHRLFEKFGRTLSAPNESYAPGDTVVAKFRAGNPRNNFLTMSSFIEVQRQGPGGRWLTIARDADPETRVTWRRRKQLTCLFCSELELQWDIPKSAYSGNYRILNRGHHKTANGRIVAFEGITEPFVILATPNYKN